jgi:hypothetical protein
MLEASIIVPNWHQRVQMVMIKKEGAPFSDDDENKKLMSVMSVCTVVGWTIDRPMRSRSEESNKST